MTPSILFVAHVGDGIGLGHLNRSFVAATSLLVRLDIQIDFVAVGRNIETLIAPDLKFNFSVESGSIDLVIDRLMQGKVYSMICLDLFDPLLTADLAKVLENVKKRQCQIVAIDSLKGFERYADMLYVPSFLPPVHLEDSQFDGHLAYGWDSYLLNVSPENPVSNKSRAVLILTGGSDVTHLGKRWPKILNEKLPIDSTVHWVTGPFSERPSFPEHRRLEFVEYLAPVGLSPLMQEAEIAVTIFGVSFFELIALGVPTVVFSPYGEKDTRELCEIEKLKVSLVARDASEAAEKAAILLEDSDLRAELTCNARSKIKNSDGKYFAEEVRLLLANGTLRSNQ